MSRQLVSVKRVGTMMRGRESDTWVVKTSNISFELGGHTALTRTDILSL